MRKKRKEKGDSRFKGKNHKGTEGGIETTIGIGTILTEVTNGRLSMRDRSNFFVLKQVYMGVKKKRCRYKNSFPVGVGVV